LIDKEKTEGRKFRGTVPVRNKICVAQKIIEMGYFIFNQLNDKEAFNVLLDFHCKKNAREKPKQALEDK
jgi:hypothetical protein